MKCPFGTILDEKHDPTTVLCQKFSEACGCHISVKLYHCKVHEAAGIEKPIEDVPRLNSALMQALVGRFNGGDCPRHQDANPVDITENFRKVCARLKTKKERAKVLGEAMVHWLEVGVEKNGHTPEVVEEKIAALANEHDINGELDEWALKVLEPSSPV